MRKTLILLFTALLFSFQGLMAQKPVIKQARISKEDMAKIQRLLKGADPSTYNISLVQNGKVTRLGSAQVRGLKTVSAYHKVGTRASAANEIVTTVSDYVKTVWTSSFIRRYPDKVKSINRILENGASQARVRVNTTSKKPVIKTAKLSSREVQRIQSILKTADPSTYSLYVGKSGKVTRLGSAQVRSLKTVSAYHRPGTGATAANEIVTTVSDYVKTVWTSSFIQRYPQKVKEINKILETAALRR